MWLQQGKPLAVTTARQEKPKRLLISDSSMFIHFKVTPAQLSSAEELARGRNRAGDAHTNLHLQHFCGKHLN